MFASVKRSQLKLKYRNFKELNGIWYDVKGQSNVPGTQYTVNVIYYIISCRNLIQNILSMGTDGFGLQK